MKRVSLFGLFAACVMCLFVAQAGADEPIPDLKGLARALFDEGVSAAKTGQWSSAIYYFKEADLENPDALQTWFNLAKAESEVPGYELRADALLKAYLLRQPNTPQRDAINKLRQKLEGAVRERIRVMLAGIVQPAVNMPEFCDRALFRIAEAQVRAGLYQDAEPTLVADAQKPGCPMPGSGVAQLMAAAAISGDIAMTEQYEAKLDEWLAARPQKGDETEMTLNYMEGMALLPLYTARNPNPIVLSAKEGKPYQQIMNLHNYFKSREAAENPSSSRTPVSNGFSLSGGGGSRLAACWANRQGWNPLVVREYLLRARNLVVTERSITPQERDAELVRFAIVLYMLKQQDAAIGTLDGIDDLILEGKWLKNFEVPYQGSALPIGDIANAFWPDDVTKNPPDFRTQIATLMCLDQRLEILELRRIGLNGFKFSHCYLGPDGRIKRPGQEIELVDCVEALKKNPYGNAAADYSILDGILDYADTLSDGLSLVH